MKKSKVVFESLEEWIIDSNQIADSNQETADSITQTDNSNEIEGKLNQLADNINLVKDTFSRIFSINFPNNLDYKFVSNAEIKQLSEKSSAITWIAFFISICFNILIGIAINILTTDSLEDKTWYGIYVAGGLSFVVMMILIFFWNLHKKRYSELEKELLER